MSVKDARQSRSPGSFQTWCSPTGHELFTPWKYLISSLLTSGLYTCTCKEKREITRGHRRKTTGGQKMNYEFLNEIAKLLAPIFVCAAVLLVALIIFILP